MLPCRLMEGGLQVLSGLFGTPIKHSSSALIYDPRIKSLLCVYYRGMLVRDSLSPKSPPEHHGKRGIEQMKPIHRGPMVLLET